TGEEEHGEALAGTLGVPDDAALTVSRGAGCCNGSGDRFLDGVELMVAGYLLLDLGAFVLEDDERLDQIEEPVGREDPFDEDFQRDGGAASRFVALDRLPLAHPL